MIQTTKSASNDFAEKIVLWRNSLSTMPDKLFQDLLRIYLGEIKTPYNKQDLIEKISAFLRKDEHQKAILSLLSRKEIEVIAAVIYIPNCTQDTLALFFENDMSANDLLNLLFSLEERLILYRKHGQRAEIGASAAKLIIVPYFEAHFHAALSMRNLIGLDDISENTAQIIDTPSNGIELTNNFLSAFLSSLLMLGDDVIRNTGEIKKHAENFFSEVFGHYYDTQYFSRLYVACKNLNLGTDFSAWKNFASLSALERVALIAGADVSEASTLTTRNRAETLLRILPLVPENGITKKALFRLVFLVIATENADEPPRRFDLLLRRWDETESISWVAMRLVESAVLFKLFCKTGVTKDGEDIFAVCDFKKEGEGFINCDSAFSVTFLGAMPLDAMLDFVKVLHIKKFDNANIYELNQKSAASGFDAGLSPDDILSMLKKYSLHELPQLIGESVLEWYQTFSAVKLYSGFVLSLSPANSAKAERNALFKSRIKARIAEGVYLVDFLNEQLVFEALKRCGINHAGKTVGAAKENKSISFVKLNSKPFSHAGLEQNTEKSAIVLGGDTLQTGVLMEKLEKIKEDMTPYRYEVLQHRIFRKLIIDESQLNPESVRQEKIEASGMDFSGKINILEWALENYLEVEIEGEDTEGVSNHALKGIPIHIAKQSSDALATIAVSSPDFTAAGTKKQFLIGKIKHIKRIQTSVFREFYGSEQKGL